MSRTLSDYAAQHPQEQPAPEREQTQATADVIRERQQEQAEAERLKESIARQLSKGEPPQNILYPAIKAIGILTHDAAWAEAAAATLDGVWKDLAQQSLFINADETAAERLQTMQQDYLDKLRRQTERQQDRLRKIAKGLQDVLNAIDEHDPET